MKLHDILRFSNYEYLHTKLRFCINNGIEDPKDVYIRDTEIINKNWVLNRNKVSLFHEGEIVIGLIQINKDVWLLTTIQRILKDLKTEGIGFETEILKEYEPFFGRTYVSFHKTQQSGVIKWDAIWDKLDIVKIDAECYGDKSFTSYKVEIPFIQLESIINQNKIDWFNALSHIQAIYLITNKENNFHYVGSASSKDEFLWSRWKTYVKTLHGGNIKLKKLVGKNGEEYFKKNMSFRILDYFSENYPQAKIYESENYWKDVFNSRSFGYNDN